MAKTEEKEEYSIEYIEKVLNQTKEIANSYLLQYNSYIGKIYRLEELLEQRKLEEKKSKNNGDEKKNE